jgi:hypothetical protein
MANGAIHTGISCHLDMFYRVDFPLVYGEVELNFLAHNSANENQLSRIFSRGEEGELFLKGVLEVFDIGGCLHNYEGFSQPDGLAMKYFRMASFHNQAMAVALCGNVSLAGAVQSSLLCAELAVKAGLFHLGKDEDFARNKVGHNLKVAVQELVAVGKIDQTEIESRIRILPDFVSSRYEERRWTRLELVAIASAAQAILAMIARMMSGYSFNEAICTQASA